MIETLEAIEAIKIIDDMNKDEFMYCAIIYTCSGAREIVEGQLKFIQNLEATPLRIIKLEIIPSQQLEPLEKIGIIIEVGSFYMNIYRVEDIKQKLGVVGELLSKQKCGVRLVE